MSTYTTTTPNTESVTQLASKRDYTEITRSNLTKPTNSYPLCYTTNAVIAPATTSQLLIKVSPIPDSLIVNCIFSPTSPSWSFIVGSLGQYVYNAALSVNFELDV
jgi:hypothetical protein